MVLQAREVEAAKATEEEGSESGSNFSKDSTLPLPRRVRLRLPLRRVRLELRVVLDFCNSSFIHVGIFL